MQSVAFKLQESSGVQLYEMRSQILFLFKCTTLGTESYRLRNLILNAENQCSQLEVNQSIEKKSWVKKIVAFFEKRDEKLTFVTQWQTILWNVIISIISLTICIIILLIRCTNFHLFIWQIQFSLNTLQDAKIGISSPQVLFDEKCIAI